MHRDSSTVIAIFPTKQPSFRVVRKREVGDNYSKICKIIQHPSRLGISPAKGRNSTDDEHTIGYDVFSWNISWISKWKMFREICELSN